MENVLAVIAWSVIGAVFYWLFFVPVWTPERSTIAEEARYLSRIWSALELSEP